MRICWTPESPEEFTARLDSLLPAQDTHLYFDTSFLMWLTTIGSEARSQFVAWAGTLGERTHVPLWSIHEYYRHHTGGTLQSQIINRSDELMGAAKAFQQELRRYSDQALFHDRPAAAYQDAVSKAVTQLREVSDAARKWNYDAAATEVIKWINNHACETQTVFRSMPSLKAEGSARFTQDLPPGFLDRHKKDKPKKGSNRYGDLLFWQEIIHHAREVEAATVVIVTKDRKEDWYVGVGQPELTESWKRLKVKWLPVPNPHPTLAFELKVEAQANLVLIDELYLGAFLWKFGRPQFERLAAVAIDVTPDHFDKIDPPRRPISDRAQKRREPTTIGVLQAKNMVEAAMAAPGEEVTELLQRLERDAPVVDSFIEELSVDTIGRFSSGADGKLREGSA